MATALVPTALALSRNGTAAPPSPPAPAETELSAMVVRLTPEMAFELLKNRPKNRPMSKTLVRQLITDIRNGRWICNGETIVVSDDMALLDGQHRCQAIYESGIAVEALVVMGVAQSAMASFDQGKARSASDTLSTHGLVQSKVLSGICHWVERYESHRMRQVHCRIANGDLLGFVERHAGLEASLPWARKLTALVPGSLAGAFHWLMAQRDAARAQTFFAGLSTGLGLDVSDPTYTVRQKLIQDRSTRPSHLQLVAKAALLCLGWNCLRRGQRLPQGLVWRGVQEPETAFPAIL
jgi:hypothetical protein